MRTALIIAILLFAFAPTAQAENPTPYSGTVTIETQKSFGAYVKKLLASISANKMGVVAHACADCGAKNIGITISGNRVIMIFHPRFAVRMLNASIAAGIEAPVRLYVTENTDGSARLTYRKPSHIFGAYKVKDLDVMAEELDAVIAKIITESRG
jgi:uncharacterized protein (DUF302 family)